MSADAGGRSSSAPPDDRPVGWGLTAALGAGLPLGMVALWVSGLAPSVVESVYVRHVFPFVHGGLRRVAELTPVHLAEALLIALFSAVVMALLRGAVARVRGRRSLSNLMLHGLSTCLRGAGVLYLFFLLAWGFNHARQPYAEHAGLEIAPVERVELDELLGWLVLEANELRAGLADEELGLETGPDSFDPRLEAAYARLAEEVPTLASERPLLRRAFLSPALSRLGITGIYSPFTAEAHLNDEIVDWLHPFVAAHEAAHCKGFAREDEANFIAWQVCRRSDEPALRYSATLVALQHTSQALAGVLAEGVGERLEALAQAVRDDLRRDRDFWSERRSFVTDLGRASNDAYLKLQGQAEGARSYGRMVDLLVAERRAL